MTVYAVGDVQGCFRTFQRLLTQLAFTPAEDRLWLAGDLVNRGPRSLEMLRWVKEHDNRVAMVLGNHDIHLLSRFAGVAEGKKQDTLDAFFSAPDGGSLVTWLRQQPLLVRQDDTILVHAGIDPRWSLAEAESRARAAETLLAGPRWQAALSALRQKDPGPEFADFKETLAVFTRMRMVGLDGTPRYEYNGPPEAGPADQVAWFASSHRQHQGITIVFGHWAALGLRLQPGIIALDSGCVWGNRLSAVRLRDRMVFQERYAD